MKGDKNMLYFYRAELYSKTKKSIENLPIGRCDGTTRYKKIRKHTDFLKVKESITKSIYYEFKKSYPSMDFKDIEIVLLNLNPL